jgi:hypothetical protein
MESISSLREVLRQAACRIGCDEDFVGVGGLELHGSGVDEGFAGDFG